MSSILNRRVQAFIGSAAVLLAAVFIVGCKTEVNISGTALETYALMFNAGEHGGIDAKAGDKKINTGATLAKDTVITFTATPATGYKVDKWVVTGGELVSGTGTDGSTTAKVRVTADTKVSVSFKAETVIPPTEDFTVEMAHGVNGNISANPTIPAGGKVTKDTVITFTAMPETGYKADKWIITGGELVSGTGTDGSSTAKVKITANTKVSVSFTLQEFPVTFSPLDSNGTLKAAVDGMEIGNGDSIAYGKSVEFTATPKPGYEVDKWTCDDVEVSGNTSISYNHTVSKAINVNVRFKLKKYAVNFSVDGGNGNLSAKLAGNNFSGGEVEYGKTVEFTAASNTDYKVDKWTVTGSAFVDGTGTKGSTTAKVKVTADTTVKVSFNSEMGTPLTAGKTYTVGSVSFRMNDIAAVTNGTLGHPHQGNNQPHTVSLTAYRIGETEVTQELWQAVTGSNPSRFQGSNHLPDGTEVQEKRPVEQVSWYDSIAFCNELTKKIDELGTNECVYYSNSSYTAVYTEADAQAQTLPFMNMSKKGFRLPTEAEWEWAAKGGTEKRWSITDSMKDLHDYAWFYDNSGGKTHQVKLKEPNGYGLYDMSGNSREWCWDWYGSSTPVGGQDPLGVASGNYRIERGGGWSVKPNHAGRARRSHAPPKRNDRFYGLRLACRP